MKFNISDKVKIVKIDDADPSYLLNKVGIVVKIHKDYQCLYEIEFVDEEMKNADELLWAEHELEFDKPVINHFTMLSPESGDWDAWYLNGKLIAEGHTVRVQDILYSLTDVFPNTYKTIEITDEKAEEGFDVNLENMI